MAKKNVKRIFVGLALIALAVVGGVGSFYLLEVKPEMQRRAALERRLAKPSAAVQPSAPVVASTPAPGPKQTQAPAARPVTPGLVSGEVQGPAKEPPKTISLESILEKAKTVYPPQEQARKDGFLWIDRKTSKWVVTLGAIHGLKTDSSLTVYKEDKVVGQVKVTRPFDVISYVQPMENAAGLEQGGYFRVVIQ